MAQDGTYAFPQLSPGVYQLKNNGEMDNSTSDGNELVEIYQVVTVKDAAVSDVNFTLTDGISVSGTLSIANGATENGRDVVVFLDGQRPEKNFSDRGVFDRQLGVVHADACSGGNVHAVRAGQRFSVEVLGRQRIGGN